MAFTAYYTPLRLAHILLPRAYISSKNQMLLLLQVEAKHFWDYLLLRYQLYEQILIVQIVICI